MGEWMFLLYLCNNCSFSSSSVLILWWPNPSPFSIFLDLPLPLFRFGATKGGTLKWCDWAPRNWLTPRGKFELFPSKFWFRECKSCVHMYDSHGLRTDFEKQWFVSISFSSSDRMLELLGLEPLHSFKRTLHWVKWWGGCNSFGKKKNLGLDGLIDILFLFPRATWKVWLKSPTGFKNTPPSYFHVPTITVPMSAENPRQCASFALALSGHEWTRTTNVYSPTVHSRLSYTHRMKRKLAILHLIFL